MFLKNQSHNFKATTQFISVPNGVILVLRVGPAQFITRSITSHLPRTLAGGVVHSVYMKRQYSIMGESTAYSCVTLAKLFTRSGPPCPHVQ